MKPVLIVDGKELEVINIYYRQGVIQTVQVHLGDDEYRIYSSKDYLFAHDANGIIDMDKCLTWIGKYDGLIDHLEDCKDRESRELEVLAVVAMEMDDLPFPERHLLEKQKEYKLNQRRLLGLIDALEEVKAYSEGYYDDKSSKGGE